MPEIYELILQSPGFVLFFVGAVLCALGAGATFRIWGITGDPPKESAAKFRLGFIGGASMLLGAVLIVIPFARPSPSGATPAPLTPTPSATAAPPPNGAPATTTTTSLPPPDPQSGS